MKQVIVIEYTDQGVKFYYNSASQAWTTDIKLATHYGSREEAVGRVVKLTDAGVYSINTYFIVE